MTLTIPSRGLVLLIGAAGSGKSTFARRHFKSTEIVSSDALRAAVSDEESDQSASGDAFHLLRLIAAMRLRRGKLTVIDATNVRADARKGFLGKGPAAAIVFNLPLEICLTRNQARADRQVSPEVVEKQAADLAVSLPGLSGEGFQYVYLLDNTADIETASILRT